MDAVLAGMVVPNVQNHSLAALARAADGDGFASSCVPFRGFCDIDSVARAVHDQEPRLFGLSIQASEAALASATLIEVLRRRGFTGIVVAGGHFATLNAEDLLGAVRGIDVVVRFAGEAALLALLRRGLQQELADVPGVVFRDRSGAICHGATPTLDMLPRTFLGKGEDQPVHLGFRAADLVLSRGCEAHCSYCCVAGAADIAETFGTRYQRRDPEQIAELVASLYHGGGVRVFNFMDDNLLPLDPASALDWVEAVGDGLSRRKVGRIAFSLQLRADACTRPIVESLAALGLCRAYVGIDGYSGRQLVALGRNAPADAGPEALAKLAAAGIFTVCNALILGPTFRFETVLGEIEALAGVRHAPVHLLPIEVRAGSAYFERARRRGLLEGGALCRRYRFEDSRTALLAEALLGFPTRLEEYSVPVALYDLGYNLGIARRLLPGSDVRDPIETYRDVTDRWNADQIRILRAAAEAAGSGERRQVRDLVGEQGGRVRRLDDELRALVSDALSQVERVASRSRGETVRSHLRGRLISAVAFSAALAACDRETLVGAQDSGMDAIHSADRSSLDARIDDNDAASCPDGLLPREMLPSADCSGNFAAQTTFDPFGVPGAVTQVDGGTIPQDALDCLQQLLAGYCYPSYAGTTQTLISHHFWIA